MKSNGSMVGTESRRRSWIASSLLALAMLFLLSIFVIGPNSTSTPLMVTSGVWALFLAFITLIMLRSGKIYRPRLTFFVIYGLSFVAVFVSELIASRGSMALTAEVIQAREVPLCPVAIPQLILPAVLKGRLIFPTKLVGGPFGGFYPILLMWILSVLVLGRAWCSWGCFFGGLDESSSKLLRRPILPTRKMNPRLRYLPFAVLIIVVAWAFSAMSPVYCSWLCPLKLVTEYPAIDSPLRYLQAVVFISLGVLLLLLLPLLTKKRIQCGLFCPLGALQSLLGRLNPYRIFIDKNKCTKCGRCIEICPTFSITKESLTAGKVTSTCSLCGKCEEACPRSAFAFAFAGTGIASMPSERPPTSLGCRIRRGLLRIVSELADAKALFLFSAVLFGGILSGSFVPSALWRFSSWVVKIISR